LLYLKGKNISATGITISKEQYLYCKSKKLDVYLMDFTKITSEFDGKFDIITYLGSSEHICNRYMSDNEASIYFTHVINDTHRLFNKKNTNKLFLSTLVWNSKHNWNLRDKIYRYILNLVYSGYYFYDNQHVQLIENTLDYKLETMANLTEDYRYVTIRDKFHTGNGKSVLSLNFNKILYFLYYFVTDPFYIYTLPYLIGEDDYNIWMWQFGGTHKNIDMKKTKESPCQCYWYVFKYEQHKSKNKFSNTCNI
jgi:hypothetical protein